jgi:hypothetical protein
MQIPNWAPSRKQRKDYYLLVFESSLSNGSNIIIIIRPRTNNKTN